MTIGLVSFYESEADGVTADAIIDSLLAATTLVQD